MSAATNIVKLESRRGLKATSKHWQCQTRVELVSASVDDDLEGVGHSPVPGDFSSTGVTVPDTPTVDQEHRYLIRLCGAEIPGGAGLIVRGIRQGIMLRADYALEDGEGNYAGTYSWFKEQTSPWWRFIDGNVSFHLKWTQQVQSKRHIYDPLQRAGVSPTTFGVDSAVLYVPTGADPLGPPYTPPGAGIPPGRDVDFLGTLRDLRYPWDNTDWSLHVPVIGPGVVTLYASVYQTDPDTRLAPPQLVPPAPFTDPVLCGMRPEDQFLLQHPKCRYARVAGALLLDLFPCCQDMERES